MVTASELCSPLLAENVLQKDCFENFGKGLRVKNKYIKKIAINGFKKGVFFVSDLRELVAVDASGNVILRNIFHAGDYDYPSANLGLGRFAVKSYSDENKLKCGYFDEIRLIVVVPAIYDNCSAFKDGFAEACVDCARYCTEPECQSSVFLGGNGFLLNGQGKISKRYNMPTLDSICGGTDEVELSPVIGTDQDFLRCKPPSVQNLQENELVMPNLPLLPR